MTTHSKIGASGMYRWSQCPGSVRLSEGLANTSSQYAVEGTAAHELAEVCLIQNHNTERYVGQPIFVGDTAVDVSEEMAEAVQVYLDTVRHDLGDPSPEVTMLVEHKFDLSDVHPGLFGTADCVVLYRHARFMRVYDYKNGAGVAVDPENNPQLMYYALGALLTVANDIPIKRVEIVIVQPNLENAEPVKRWSIDAIELLDFATELVQYAKATEAPDAPLNPGEWCKFCPAAAVCPALEKKVMDAFDEVKVPVDAVEYSPAKLAETLRWLPIFEGWVKSVREFAYGEATRGASIPGWKLVDKVARRQWQDEGTCFTALRALGLAAADIQEVKLKSPAKVEKLLPPERRPALEPLVVKESSGTSLVHDSDKRPAVASVADAFDSLLRR